MLRAQEMTVLTLLRSILVGNKKTEAALDYSSKFHTKSVLFTVSSQISRDQELDPQVLPLNLWLSTACIAHTTPNCEVFGKSLTLTDLSPLLYNEGVI